jgi:hypothetical protein
LGNVHGVESRGALAAAFGASLGNIDDAGSSHVV